MSLLSRRYLATAVLLTLGGLLALVVAHAQSDDGGEEISIPGGRAVHGLVQAGVTADHLTLRDSSGAGVVQVVTNPSTRIRRSRVAIHLNEIRPGETVFAFGTLDESAHVLHALVVGVLDAADLKRAEQDLGKTYITGTVVSISDLHLVIHRPDGVEQTIAVDEGTSFRRSRRRRSPGGQFGAPQADGPAPGSGSADDGESITLADVHPGNYILANGALQHGVFVPAILRVLPPMSTTNGQRSAGNPGERPR